MALIKMYAQTGFDAVNIPDSISMLQENFTAIKEYEDYNVIQTEYLAYVTVDDMSPELARRIDYVTIESDESNLDKSCYTVETYEMQAPEVCKFTLLLDAYNTMGGLGAESGNMVVSGSAERLSVSIEEDNANFYPLDEPFAPSERSENVITKLADITDSYLIIETLTVPPRTLTETPMTQYDMFEAGGVTYQYYDSAAVGGITINTGTGDSAINTFTKMIVPNGRPLIPTTYSVNLPDGTYKSVSLGTRLWRHDSDAENNNKGIEYEVEVQQKTGTSPTTVTIKGDLFKDMRNNGRDNDIVAYYEIPKLYGEFEQGIGYNPTVDSNYGGLIGCKNKVTINNTTFAPKVVFNNKARYSQNCTVKVYSPVSGRFIDKRLFEICNPGTLPASTMVGEYFITADVRAQGSPIFGWSYLNGVSQKSSLAEVITGGNWRNVALGIEGMSNINLAQHRLESESERNEYNVGANLASVVGSAALGAAAGSIVPGLGTVAGAVVGGIGGLINVGVGYVKSSKAIQEQQELLQHQSIAASAQISVGDSNFARECGMNTFFMIVSQYSENDTADYDTFLTKFGYNVGNKRISNADFYSRPAFNFVKINDITIESITGSLNLINQVKEQLKLGVRIWHKKPNPLDMTAGGNR